MGLTRSRVHGEFVAPRIVLVLSTLVTDASLEHGTRDSCATSVGMQGGVIVLYAVRHVQRPHTDICTVVLSPAKDVAAARKLCFLKVLRETSVKNTFKKVVAQTF